MSALSVLFITMSLKYQIPYGLLSSLCYIESAHKISAINHDDGGEDSLGICQIKYSTAREMGFRGTKRQLMEPNYNIKYAAKFLSYQIKRYKGSTVKAVVAYNRGNAKNLTTSKYQRKVYKKWGNH